MNTFNSNAFEIFFKNVDLFNQTVDYLKESNLKLTKSYTEQTNRINEQTNRINEQTNRINEQTNRINELETSQENLEVEVKSLNTKVGTLQTELDFIYSISWSVISRKSIYFVINDLFEITHEIKKTAEGLEQQLYQQMLKIIFTSLINNEFCILKTPNAKVNIDEKKTSVSAKVESRVIPPNFKGSMLNPNINSKETTQSSQPNFKGSKFNQDINSKETTQISQPNQNKDNRVEVNVELKVENWKILIDFLLIEKKEPGNNKLWEDSEKDYAELAKKKYHFHSNLSDDIHRPVFEDIKTDVITDLYEKSIVDSILKLYKSKKETIEKKEQIDISEAGVLLQGVGDDEEVITELKVKDQGKTQEEKKEELSAMKKEEERAEDKDQK